MHASAGGDYKEGAPERELARLGVALAPPPEPAPVAAPLPRGHCTAAQAAEEAAFAPTTLRVSTTRFIHLTRSQQLDSRRQSTEHLPCKGRRKQPCHDSSAHIPP
jgi:hypothetical protein